MDAPFQGMTREQVEEALQHRDFAEGLEAFRQGVAELRNTALQLPVRQHPVAWVYENIRLTEKESSRPGPMRLSVYQREMANAVADPYTRQLTVLKGVQIGYSKALAALYAYAVSHLAMSASVVFPTIPDVKRYYKAEIAPLMKKVEALRSIVRIPAKGDISDTWYEQHFLNGVKSYFRGAFNEDQLQSYTAWFNAGDETDREGWQPGKDSIGDKVEQLRNRGTDFLDSKLILGSTPGLLHKSVIWRQWLLSDQRKLHVNCPHCSFPQVLKWGSDKTPYGFRWDLDEHGKVERAWYMCEGPKHCRIYEDLKEEMVESGVYLPTVQVPVMPGHVGIHAPSWISMSPGASWRILAQQWLNAQGDIEKLKEFVTFKMAEPWDDLQSQSFNEETVNSRQRPYPAEVPDDVVLLTCGIDTQTNKEGNEIAAMGSYEASVVGWNRFRMPRLIGHWIIRGDPGDKATDDELEALIKRKFRKGDGTEMVIQATTVDMGGHYPDQVRAFAHKHRKNNVWAIRGANLAKGTRKPTVWPSGKARRSGKGHIFFTVDSQGARDAVARMLLSSASEGAMFPSSLTRLFPDYFDKLTCEQRSLQKNGGYWWHPKKGRRAEEVWMCLAYSYVALCGLQHSYPGRWRDLNVAAKAAGIPELPPHDPETGELRDSYNGPDQSAHAAAAPEPAPEAVSSPAVRQSNAQKAEPVAAPKPTGAVKRKKRRVMRVIR